MKFYWNTLPNSCIFVLLHIDIFSFCSLGVEVRCIGHFKLLFSLLRLTGAEKLQKLALEVVSTVTGNGKCVASIAEADVLAYLLLTLNTLPSSKCEHGFHKGFSFLHTLIMEKISMLEAT